MPEGFTADFGAMRRKRPEKRRQKFVTDKVKYQIFLSSTFIDLKEERQAVSRAILELNHIPAGMELFPAFDQSQLEFIKRVIDDCDYYVIIIGGRYGSLTPEGISFTESEYDYAVSREKPVIGLLHADVGKIPSERVDADKELLEKLAKFRAKIQKSRLVKTWSNIDELRSGAIISLTTTFDQMPQVGWRRNDGIDSEDVLQRLDFYRGRMESVETRVREYRRRLVAYEDLDSAEIDVKFKNDVGSSIVAVSADQLIREFAAPLKNGFDKSTIRKRLISLIRHRFDGKVIEVSEEAVENVVLFFEVFEIVQENDSASYSIAPDKLHLLKAAFRKTSDSANSPADDEIPF